MVSNIVIGLGYGDEGKGLTTDYLCRQYKNPLVIRFSGGHQAGHTVVTQTGKRHVFSSFGSGTLQDVASYWSRYCTFYPVAFYNEWTALKELGHVPTIYVDALAPVTTPYDVFYNQQSEKINAHGSCGVGFGATIQRNDGPYKLYVQDLFYPNVLHQKLLAINAYYRQQTKGNFSESDLWEKVEIFKEYVEAILPTIRVVHESTFFSNALKMNTIDAYIFEGSQGILLDKDHGFFPNVTRANTTSKYALRLIQHNHLPTPTLYYITRAYQTRHGNGYLSNENLPLDYTPNPNETNQYNPWQGHQRCSVLDIDMLNYALQCDQNYSGNLPKNLVVTCLDQLNSPLQATQNGKLLDFKNTNALLKSLNLNAQRLLESHSDCSLYMNNSSISFG